MLLFVTVLKPRLVCPSTSTSTPRETNPKHVTKSECASVRGKRWLTSMATRRLLNLKAAPEKSTYAGPSIILAFRSGGSIIIHLFFGLDKSCQCYLTHASLTIKDDLTSRQITKAPMCHPAAVAAKQNRLPPGFGPWLKCTGEGDSTSGGWRGPHCELRDCIRCASVL